VYEDLGKRSDSLVPKSTKPHTEHLALTKLVKLLREQHPRIEKMKAEATQKLKLNHLLSYLKHQKN
jgi:hypothetical protein